MLFNLDFLHFIFEIILIEDHVVFFYQVYTLKTKQHSSQLGIRDNTRSEVDTSILLKNHEI